MQRIADIQVHQVLQWGLNACWNQPTNDPDKTHPRASTHAISAGTAI